MGVDKLFSGMRISATGLAAERVRIDVIAENIANARTTTTPGGGAYRRKVVHFEPLLRRNAAGGHDVAGVRAAQVVADYSSPMERIHDPSHPDSNAQGFVEMPNVNTVIEMADLITALRAYEANITVKESFTRMAERALELAR